MLREVCEARSGLDPDFMPGGWQRGDRRPHLGNGPLFGESVRLGGLIGLFML
jgi:hypothetical protein